MALNSDFEDAFYKGQAYWQKNNFAKARYWYEISVNDSNLKYASLFKLIQIEIKEGKYLKARQILNENKNVNNLYLKQAYGMLENVENNFEQSKKYYSECMVNKSMQYKSLFALAKLYVQTGDYEVARKMLETLLLNPDFYVQAIFGLVSLNFLERNYFEAQRLLNEINVSKLIPKFKQYYESMLFYVKYFLDNLKISDNKLNSFDDYTICRLYNHSEEKLLYHIEKHCNQKEKETNGCFFEDIDLKKLLYDARDRIEDMNGNHSGVADIYRFKLDTPIGYKGDLITNDLCVVTIIGTKDITTMYPVLLSEEFDKEGLSMSKELKLKRLKGEIKNDK